MADPLSILTGIGGLGTQAASIFGLIQQMLDAQARREDPFFADLQNIARSDFEQARNAGGPFGDPFTGFGGSLGVLPDGRPVQPGEVIAEQLARILEGNQAGATQANLGALSGLTAPQGASFQDIIAGAPSEPFAGLNLPPRQELPSPVSTQVGLRGSTPLAAPGEATNLAGTSFVNPNQISLPRAEPAPPFDLGALTAELGDAFNFVSGGGLPGGGGGAPNNILAGLFGGGQAPPAGASPFPQGGAGGRANIATGIKSRPIGFDGLPAPIDPATGLPSLQQGGFVPSDQLVKLHRGEQVIPANDGRLNGQQFTQQAQAPPPPAPTLPPPSQAPAPQPLAAPPPPSPFPPPPDTVPAPGDPLRAPAPQPLAAPPPAPTQPQPIPEQPNPLQGFIDQFQDIVNRGGPITGDVLAGLQGQIADTAAGQLQNQQRAIAENLGARGFGTSGLAEQQAFEARLASDANVLGQQRTLGTEAAITNFGAVQDALQRAADTAQGGLGIGVQQGQLDLARELGFNRLDLEREVGIGGLGLQFEQLQRQGFENDREFERQLGLDLAQIGALGTQQQLSVLDRFLQLTQLGVEFSNDMFQTMLDIANQNFPSTGGGTGQTINVNT